MEECRDTCTNDKSTREEVPGGGVTEQETPKSQVVPVMTKERKTVQVSKEGATTTVSRDQHRHYSHPSRYSSGIILSMSSEMILSMLEDSSRLVAASPEIGGFGEEVPAPVQAKPTARPSLGKRSKMSTILIGSPIDYSFWNVTDLKDLTKMKPRSVRVRTVPHCAPSGRYLTASIWASYNNVHSMVGVASFVRKVLEIPEALTLLDLSFNQIHEISEEISLFPHLKVLHLHSNKIDSYTQVVKLLSLEELQTLTLKGNPIERKSNYRDNVIQLLPQIKTLDFNRVTMYERYRCQTVNVVHLKKGPRHK